MGGKTGTAESYGDKKNRINTFISIFPANKPDYALFVMLENPKINKELVYDYRGIKTKALQYIWMEFSLCCWQNNKKLGQF